MALDQRIERDDGVCGGKPRISGHRITVQDIVVWHERMGKSGDEIANEYDLSLADVYTALAYYFVHREDIDRSIEESRDYVEKMKEQMTSKRPGCERVRTRSLPSGRAYSANCGRGTASSRN